MRVDKALLREASELLAAVAVPPGADEHWRERALAVVSYLDGLPDEDDADVLVLLGNSYECGRSSHKYELVRGRYADDEDLDTWWTEVVSPLTGDGHPCGSRDHALYTALVVWSGTPSVRVGESNSWEG
jgi:hypothetical protein